MAPDKVVGIIGASLTLVGSCLLAYDAFGEPSRVRSNQADLELAAYFDKRNVTYVSPDNKPVTPDTIETGGADNLRLPSEKEWEPGWIVRWQICLQKVSPPAPHPPLDVYFLQVLQIKRKP